MRLKKHERSTILHQRAFQGCTAVIKLVAVLNCSRLFGCTPLSVEHLFARLYRYPVCDSSQDDIPISYPSEPLNWPE